LKTFKTASSKINTSLDSNKLRITNDERKIAVNTINGDLLPALYDGSFNESPSLVYRPDTFERALKYLSLAVCREVGRPQLHAIWFSQTHAFSTDGHRLHIVDELPDLGEGKLGLNQPTVSALLACFRYATFQRVFLRQHGNIISYTLSGDEFTIEITTRLNDYTPVDWRVVMPKSCDFWFGSSVKALDQALKTMIKVGKANDVYERSVVFETKTSGIEIGLSDAYQELIKCPTDQGSKPIGLNPHYVIDAICGAAKDEEVALSRNKSIDPVMVEISESRRALIMPSIIK